MHIHVAGSSVLQLDRLGDGFTTSFGDDPPSVTDVLVSGRPDLGTLGALERLSAVVVPFAGVPEATLEVVRAYPELGLYNLHHNAAATAEKAIELMIAVAKGTLANDGAMRVADWSPRFQDGRALQLDGRTALVLGYGAIGKRVARVCLGLGMRVEAVRRVVRHAFDGDVSLSSVHALRKLLPRAHVVIIALPLTPETRGMLGAEELALLPADAILINVARGAIVEEEALFRVLSESRIHGAGLDVWWTYPKAEGESCTPSAFDFASLANVVMSPHVGGATRESEQRRGQELSRLVLGLRTNNAEEWRVDLDAGY